CPNPSCPLCVATVVTALAQVAATLARRQRPYQGAATPTAGVVTPAGGKADRGPPCGRPIAGPPLRAPYSRPPFAGAALQVAMPAGGCYPRSFVGGLGCGLAMAGRPSSSLP
ncbi:hypothetical protein BHM03_00017732, partial [Ensete ventricosum]